MSTPEVSPEAIVSAVLTELGARAAGLWKLEGNHLTQVVFIPGAGLTEDVAREFAQATERVSLDQRGLGIVVAATRGEIAVSRASELPENSGSRLWLHRFNASRSVAVPLLGPTGAVVGVISVALATDPRDDLAVAEHLRGAARAWSESVRP